jgi:signal transduction histidine kinase
MAMWTFLTHLFDPSDFVPRSQCGRWTPALIRLHNVADAMIWLAYIAIPIILVSFAHRRRDLPFPWMFGLFGAFIIGCGFTHFMEIVVFYVPLYRFAGLLKLATGIVSWGTVLALIPVVPRALALRGPQELQREIEERKRVEEQLRDLAARLERSNRELQEFASVASHDLQEPLRKIQAFGDRLKAKSGAALGDEGRDSLERMQNAAERMRTLINDLLTFSRVTTQARPFVPVSLTTVAREVVSDLEGRIQQTGGTVQIDDLPTIEADPTQMRQLLQNLIGNGLKFHRPGIPPVIRLHGRTLAEDGDPREGEPASPGLCRIVVEDNGIGFDEKYLDRIFNVFQRLHGRGEYEGTGMGLAICRKIVERHDGGITARSAPGRGATFLVTLPLKPSPGGTPRDESRQVDPDPDGR